LRAFAEADAVNLGERSCGLAHGLCSSQATRRRRREHEGHSLSAVQSRAICGKKASVFSRCLNKGTLKVHSGYVSIGRRTLHDAGARPGTALTATEKE
jgi:hypothetical protein